MAEFKIGYTQGVFDMFHVGHLNLLRRAREHCDRLIVGVNSDALVQSYKHKTPVIREKDRLAIVSSIRYVDDCLLAETLDKLQIHAQVPFDAIFIGDDWKGNERWRRTEEDLAAVGARVIYLPYTDGVSSTELRPQADRSVSG